MPSGSRRMFACLVQWLCKMSLWREQKVQKRGCFETRRGEKIELESRTKTKSSWSILTSSWIPWLRSSAAWESPASSTRGEGQKERQTPHSTSSSFGSAPSLPGARAPGSPNEHDRATTFGRPRRAQSVKRAERDERRGAGRGGRSRLAQAQ